jgi:hypothetical protein
LVDEFYLALLARFPTPVERTRVVKHLGGAPDGASPLEQARDVVWALINTKEFLYSH